MNTQWTTPETTVGLRITRRGETVFIGVATFLYGGLIMLGAAGLHAIPYAEVPPPAPATSTSAPWVQVSQPLGDALSEGEDYGTPPRTWESCVTNGRMIACPDGFKQTI